MEDFQALRKEYASHPLDSFSLLQNPFEQFQNWLEEAWKHGIIEPNAMVLATSTLNGVPSSRTVLLKQIDQNGFVFFTNYQSRKGHEILHNPHVSATFLWKEMERQVVIEGITEKISREESASYFATRPRGTQLGAWASSQDREIPNKEVLIEAYQSLEKTYEGKEIPVPPYWGGYRIKPYTFEFWQGQRNRLHDRFRYFQEDAKWKIVRLSP